MSRLSEVSKTYPSYPVAYRVLLPKHNTTISVLMDVSTEDYDVLKVHIKLKGGDWAGADLEEGESPYAALDRLVALLDIELMEATPA